MKPHRNRIKTSASIMAAAVLLVSPVASAGGLMVWEIGTPTLGTAGAGWAAMPEDASTAYTNPAGTVWRDDTEIMASGQLMYGHLDFSDGGQSNVPGNDGGNAIEWFPGGGFFAAGRLTDSVGWGFAMAGNMGGVLDYDNDWKGRRFVTDVSLIGMSLLPSLSWKASDCLSLGLGLNIMGGYYKYESRPRAGLLGGDARLKYDDTDVAFGANLGVIYKPTATTTLGLSYTSKVDWEFRDDLRLRDFGPLFSLLVSRLNGARTDIDMDVPQTVTLSLQQRLSAVTTLYANVNWQEWSEFGFIGFQIDNPDQTSATINREYDDTWHGALGIRHQYSAGALQGWSLSAGIGYDSSMEDLNSRTADLVVDKTWRLGLGARKELCPGLRLDVGYTLAWVGDPNIDQSGRPPFSPRLQGSYDDYSLNFFGASVQFEL
ncbi:long-chain fatty acid transport protein [Microbulbifer donghaiensis]|uniref:Long-chain fatty acid transport protein n=1 Tax=Microbulbifer donghaiensis TaxID=494016 RepID=A0A1M4VTS6_9GAMM|nr:outer membrane protein transport protein [Microbulbifer donghaiensis]SHE72265.1 long-chain fatty acid transport protein [Microbulbifer donghaiensis]